MAASVSTSNNRPRKRAPDAMPKRVVSVSRRPVSRATSSAVPSFEYDGSHADSSGYVDPGETNPAPEPSPASGGMSRGYSVARQRLSRPDTVPASGTRYPSWKEQERLRAQEATTAASGGAVATSGDTKYPSWKDAQKQATDQQLSPQVRRANRQKALRAYSGNVKERMSSGEMSPVMGYALIALSCFGAILDFITGFIPGVNEVVSTAITTIMTIIILLDPELRKQAAADRVKLILKRLVLNWAIGLFEMLYFINLLPTEVIGAVITVKMRVKAKLER